jgi:RND superfamily putative drug exporter
MVAVFGGFALGDMVMLQQMGFGLAVAVLVDATIIRSVMVPATMRLLGDRNWYMPKWLEWLPNVSIGESTCEEVEPRRPVEREEEQPVWEPVPMPVPIAPVPVVVPVITVQSEIRPQ